MVTRSWSNYYFHTPTIPFSDAEKKQRSVRLTGPTTEPPAVPANLFFVFVFLVVCATVLLFLLLHLLFNSRASKSIFKLSASELPLDWYFWSLTKALPLPLLFISEAILGFNFELFAWLWSKAPPNRTDVTVDLCPENVWIHLHFWTCVYEWMNECT